MARPVSVELLVPGLSAAFEGISADCFPVAPRLSRLLSRAGRVAETPVAAETLLCSRMGMDCPDQTRLPAAALSWLGDYGCLPSQDCLLLEPVHLRADTRGLLLFDAGCFPLSAEHSAALAQALDPILDEEGWRLEIAGHHWYLLGDSLEPACAEPFSCAVGATVGDRMFHGERARRWQTLLNEMQMLLHAAPVNLQRAAEGLPPVNSVWIWGGGAVPDFAGCGYAELYCDSALGRGLSAWAGISGTPVPENARALMAGGGEGPRLVVLPDGQAAAAHGDFETWSRAVAQLENAWFAPLLQALSRGGLGELRLSTGDGAVFRLRRPDLWRPWRRIHPWHRLLRGSL